MAVLHEGMAGMRRSVESYIIRIYRGDHKHPRDLVGIVEEVGVREKKAFTNLDELCEILKSIKKNRDRQSRTVSF